MSYTPPTATPFLTAFERFLARNPALLAEELQEAQEQRQEHGLATILVLSNTGEYTLIREEAVDDPPSPPAPGAFCAPPQEVRLAFPVDPVLSVDRLLDVLRLNFLVLLAGHFSNIWKRRYLQQAPEYQPGN